MRGISSTCRALPPHEAVPPLGAADGISGSCHLLYRSFYSLGVAGVWLYPHRLLLECLKLGVGQFAGDGRLGSALPLDHIPEVGGVSVEVGEDLQP